MKKEIKSRIIKTELVDISELTPFQGETKKLSDINFNKLRKVLIDEGFSFTIHVWETSGKIFIIDGHQRVSVMKSLLAQGYSIPKVNCAFISAKNFKEAKKLVLLAISQYGKIDKKGFHDFIGEDEFAFTDFELPDLPSNFWDDDEPEAEFKKELGTLGSNPVISYQIIFDDEEQQDRWYQFLKDIKTEYPDHQTTGSRVIQFIRDIADG